MQKSFSPSCWTLIKNLTVARAIVYILPVFSFSFIFLTFNSEAKCNKTRCRYFLFRYKHRLNEIVNCARLPNVTNIGKKCCNKKYHKQCYRNVYSMFIRAIITIVIKDVSAVYAFLAIENNDDIISEIIIAKTKIVLDSSRSQSNLRAVTLA